jgi:hypothetical protein
MKPIAGSEGIFYDIFLISTPPEGRNRIRGEGAIRGGRELPVGISLGEEKNVSLRV